MYGRDYTLEELTVSRTAERRGMSNLPATEAHESNLALLEDFLNSVPFEFMLTSVYRSPAVNTAVGGAKSSQHMHALAVDLVPLEMDNKELATWLWANQEDYPELDQVIWYRDTNHVHIAVCPPGAQGCVSGAPRGRFYEGRNESSGYTRWLPDDASLAEVLAMYRQTRPVRFAVAKYAAIAIGIGGAVLIYALWQRRQTGR
jgi:zinc D-Ala-D-Ala carboxypeptidase